MSTELYDTTDVILYVHQPLLWPMRSIYIPKNKLTQKLIAYIEQLQNTVKSNAPNYKINPEINEVVSFFDAVCDGSPSYYHIFALDTFEKTNALEYNMPEWYSQSILCYGWEENFDKITIQQLKDCDKISLNALFNEMKKERILQERKIRVVDSFIHYEKEGKQFNNKFSEIDSYIRS